MITLLTFVPVSSSVDVTNKTLSQLLSKDNYNTSDSPYLNHDTIITDSPLTNNGNSALESPFIIITPSIIIRNQGIRTSKDLSAENDLENDDEEEESEIDNFLDAKLNDTSRDEQVRYRRAARSAVQRLAR